MSADRRQEGAAASAEVPSEEGPDSLMSRLDGSEPSQEKEEAAKERPSAAELLGGRGKRRRAMAIRVPDDATPPPPPVKRSQPPPAPAPTPTATTPTAKAAPSASVIASPSETPTVRIMPTRIIGVGSPSAVAPPTGSGPAQDHRASADVPPLVAAASSSASPSNRPPSARLSTPYPMPTPFTANPSLPNAGSIAAGEVVIKPVPVPAGALISQPLEPIAPPSTTPVTPSQPTPPKAPTVQNLDKAVKDALDLLDREDFETTAIDIAVTHDQDEETHPKLPAVDASGPASEESLDDSVVEEVEPRRASGMKAAAPAPPPRKTGQSGQQAKAFASNEVGQTLPSARVTEGAAPASPLAAPATSLPTTEPAASASTATPAPTPTPLSPDQTSEIKKKKRQWFEELFNDDFVRTVPRIPVEYIDREVAFIDDSLGCEKGATILDLGCGPGEHAVRLSKRGYEVIGIDLSLAMLARAADEAAALDTRINFVQGDMRELTFEESFDGVYCWGTTFGYFDEQKNVEVVGKVHRSLKRGGRVLLDVVNRDYVMSRQPSMAWFEGEGCVCMDEMYINAITSRMHVKRTMMMEDGRQREIDYSIRLYSLHELGKLLHDAGFRVVEASGDTSTPGVYFGAESPRILILAEKR